MRNLTETQVEKLRRRFPRWSHLTDAQLVIAAKILAVARVKFKLEKASYEQTAL